MSMSTRKLCRIQAIDQGGTVMDAFAMLTDTQLGKVAELLGALMSEGFLMAYKAEAFAERRQLHVQMLTYEALAADIAYLRTLLKRDGPSMSGPKDWSPFPNLLPGAASWIAEEIARTFFVIAWADAMEERGKTFPGQNLFGVAPVKIPQCAERAAKEFVNLMEAANRMPLIRIYAEAVERAGLKDGWRVRNDFGYLTAMEALRSGVSWTTDYKPHGMKVPHYEFSMCDLDESDLALEEYGL